MVYNVEYFLRTCIFTIPTFFCIHAFGGWNCSLENYAFNVRGKYVLMDREPHAKIIGPFGDLLKIHFPQSISNIYDFEIVGQELVAGDNILRYHNRQ